MSENNLKANWHSVINYLDYHRIANPMQCIFLKDIEILRTWAPLLHSCRTANLMHNCIWNNFVKISKYLNILKICPLTGNFRYFWIGFVQQFEIGRIFECTQSIFTFKQWNWIIWTIVRTTNNRSVFRIWN